MRRLPPAHSTLSAGSLVASVVESFRDPEGCRERLADFLRLEYSSDSVILTGSGTQALQMALSAARRARGAPGRPIALPGYSCYDLGSAAIGADTPVVLYDIDPVTLAPDLESFARALDMRPAAVVVANLFGFPLPWRSIREACSSIDTVVIEDTAQGVGTGPTSHPAGTNGDMTVLSFGRGKGWAGGGGALLTRGRQADGIRDALTPGSRAKDGLAGGKTCVALLGQWVLARPSLYGLPASLPWLALGETRFHSPTEPHAMSAFSAAAVRRLAEPARHDLATRRGGAAAWDRAWDRYATGLMRLVRCRATDLEACAYHRYPLLTPPGLATDLAHSAVCYGVARPYPEPLSRLAPLQPYLVRQPSSLPGAERLASSLLTLPTHRYVTDRDREATLAALVDGLV